jgi:hypothetical protein
MLPARSKDPKSPDFRDSWHRTSESAHPGWQLSKILAIIIIQYCFGLHL